MKALLSARAIVKPDGFVDIEHSELGTQLLASVYHTGEDTGENCGYDENAARIAACWNACAGVEDPEQLRNSHREYLLVRNMLRKAETERDALKEELKRLLEAIEGGTKQGDTYVQPIGKAYIQYLRSNFSGI